MSLPRRLQPVLHIRRRLVLTLLAAATLSLMLRAVYLQLIDHQHLRREGDALFVRTPEIPAHRGMIVDRNGEPLAVSSPVGSIWADPQVLLDPANRDRVPALARALQQEPDELLDQLKQRRDQGKRFVYLERQLPPNVAQGIVEQSQARGVHVQREYRRYYPDAEISAHLLGYTDIDDRGQEGLERAFDAHLRGLPGEQRVLRDRLGRIVEVDARRAPRPGTTLRLSIDRRIQYYAYRALKAAVQEHRARGGSVVVLDPHNGEILALANQPAANPNDRRQRRSALLRNRAVTDVFEPGSTLKPFTVAAGLESGQIRPGTPIDTRPGYYRVGRRLVRDIHNYGKLDVAGVIRKSSNVGITKIAQSFPPERLWQLYRDLGFGTVSRLDLPGEQAGVLDHHRGWGEFEYATRAFGYGVSTTALQLARAYAVLAADGLRPPLTLQRREEGGMRGERVLSARVARQVRQMLEAVVSDAGTASRAAVPGYRVAGKTGTVHKATAGGYAEDRYISLFAGMVPASRPDMIAVVMIDEPRGKDYYGGLVAAPVFRELMRGALRVRGVVPDAIDDVVRTAAR
ncbi:MAG: penicillin-binding protein 2 [Candidatus Competibacterales bacterium]|nr:penicillin-binding protein 2 [Candidatus Competibacterales bacterium]